MGAGKYRHRVIVQKPTETQDAIGSPEITWSLFIERWVEVQGGGGNEIFAARQTQPNATHIVRMRADDRSKQITPRYRIKHRDTFLNILSIDNKDDRDIELEMVCREFVGES